MEKQRKGLTYKNLLLLKGLLFSLVLYIAAKMGNKSLIYFYLYVSMLPVRYIFSYNFEPYKYKFFPFLAFMDDMHDLSKSEVTLIYGAEGGSSEHNLKVSTMYTTTILTSSVLGFIPVFVFYGSILINVLDFIIGSFTMGLFKLLVKVIVLGLVSLLVFYLFKLNLSVKKARVKDDIGVIK